MIINMVVEAEELELGYMEGEYVPPEGQVLNMIPLPVPGSGMPESREGFRVLHVEHTVGVEGGILEHVGATIYLERLGAHQ